MQLPSCRAANVEPATSRPHFIQVFFDILKSPRRIGPGLLAGLTSLHVASREPKPFGPPIARGSQFRSFGGLVKDAADRDQLDHAVPIEQPAETAAELERRHGRRGRQQSGFYLRPLGHREPP